MAIRRVQLAKFLTACITSLGNLEIPCITKWAARWLQRLAIDRATGILGGLQRENEAMLHTASAADPLWQRRIRVYPNKSAARTLLRRHLEKLLLMWKGTPALCYSIDQPDVRPGRHVSLLGRAEASVTVTCNYHVPCSIP
jgi:hypothetical protein